MKKRIASERAHEKSDNFKSGRDSFCARVVIRVVRDVPDRASPYACLRLGRLAVVKRKRLSLWTRGVYFRRAARVSRALGRQTGITAARVRRGGVRRVRTF